MPASMDKYLYTYFLPIIQNPRGVDLPAVQPFVVIPAGETVEVVTYLGRAFSLLLEAIYAQAWVATGRDAGHFYQNQDLPPAAGVFQDPPCYRPWSDALLLTLWCEGYAEPLEIVQPTRLSLVSPDPAALSTGFQFQHMMPPRGQATFRLQNTSTEDLAFGGHFVGTAYRSDVP